MLAGAAAIRPPQTLPAWAAQIPIRWVSQTTTLGIPLGSTGELDTTEFWLGKGESMRKARTRWNLRGMRAHQRAYVATAILASKLMYAASFLPCPPAALEALKHEYWCAIWPRAPEAPATKRAPRGRISRAMAVRPPAHGGLGAIDLESRLLAQAGTYVKALCDPTFAVWKLFAADDIGTLFSRARSSVARSLGIAALGAHIPLARQSALLPCQGPLAPAARTLGLLRPRAAATQPASCPAVRSLESLPLTRERFRAEPLWFNPVLSPTGQLWGTTAADRTLAAGSTTSPKITQAGQVLTVPPPGLSPAARKRLQVIRTQLSAQVSALGLAPLYRGPAAVRSGPGGDPRVLDPPIPAGHGPRRPGPTAVILARPGTPPSGLRVGALPDGTLAEPPMPDQPLPAAPASLPRAHVILVPPGSTKQKQRWPAGRPVLAGRLDATPWVHAGLLFASPKGPRPWLEYRISAGYHALLALPATPDPGPLARFGAPPQRCMWQTVWKIGCRHVSLTAWNREIWLWATHACLPAGQFLHRIGARPTPFCEACECIDVPEDTSDHAIYYCAPARAAWGELLDRWNEHFSTAVPLSCAHAVTGFCAVPDSLRQPARRRAPRSPGALLPALAGLMISSAWRVHQLTPEEREQSAKPTAMLIWEAFARDVWARALVAITKAEYAARGLSPADAQPALDPSAITWAWEPDDDPPPPPSPVDPLIWTAAGFVATIERTETETVPSRGPLLEPPPDFDSPDVPW
eukprot:tig00000383_g24611.t1